MRTKALGAKTSASAPSASPAANGRLTLSIRPPPAAAPARRKLRRERAFADGSSLRPEARDVGCSTIMVSSLSLRCGPLDRFANTEIGPAATDVAGHRVIDLSIGRMRV